MTKNNPKLKFPLELTVPPDAGILDYAGMNKKSYWVSRSAFTPKLHLSVEVSRDDEDGFKFVRLKINRKTGLVDIFKYVRNDWLKRKRERDQGKFSKEALWS